jgi:hypothetical protein
MCKKSPILTLIAWRFPVNEISKNWRCLEKVWKFKENKPNLSLLAQTI